MIYRLKGICEYEGTNEYDEFFMIIEADSYENAKVEAQKKLSKNERIVAYSEVTIEQCLSWEEDELREFIENDYIYRQHPDCTVREYADLKKRFMREPKFYYDVLVEFNRKIRLHNKLLSNEVASTLTAVEYNDLINKLMNAKTEEEFDAILQSANKKN